jgi:hypothetical protein
MTRGDQQQISSFFRANLQPQKPNWNQNLKVGIGSGGNLPFISVIKSARCRALAKTG